MDKPDTIVLEATGVRYYSHYDEAAFFEWLDKLKCVTKYSGEGLVLEIEVQLSAVDDSELRNLIALFFRYGIDMKQLAIFNQQKFAKWFRDEKAYWFTSVFGSPP